MTDTSFGIFCGFLQNLKQRLLSASLPGKKKKGMITLKCFSNTHFRADLRTRYKEHFEAIMDEMAAFIPATFPNGLFTPWR